MKQKVAGSVLLIILCSTAGLLLFITTVYRTTLLSTDVVVQKKLFEQQKWYAHGLLNWGLAVATTQFDDLMLHLEQGSYLEVSLKLAENIPIQQVGTLRFKKRDAATVHLQADAHNSTSACTITCVLERQMSEGQKPKYYINDWAIGG